MDFGYYNMDCMDGMKDFPDGYFDPAIVDPPAYMSMVAKIGIHLLSRKMEQKHT